MAADNSCKVCSVSFTVGFPSPGVLPDGQLMVTWYCGTDTDHTATLYALIG